MTLQKEQKNTSIPLPVILILLGMWGLFMGYEGCNEIIAEDRLTSMDVTVKRSPKQIRGTKRTPTHYRFYSNENLSPFSISEAWSVINDNDSLKLALKQIKTNDTLKVIFQTIRQNRLDKPLDPIEVYGLADSKREYFSPGAIAGRKRKQTKLAFLGGSALLIAGLALKIKKSRSKFNPPATT